MFVYAYSVCIFTLACVQQMITSGATAGLSKAINAHLASFADAAEEVGAGEVAASVAEQTVNEAHAELAEASASGDAAAQQAAEAKLEEAQKAATAQHAADDTGNILVITT